MTYGTWERFSGATPMDKWVLLWFIGKNAPAAARSVTLGQISSYEPGMVWDGHGYRPLGWFTHWMPLPGAPEDVDGELARSTSKTENGT